MEIPTDDDYIKTAQRKAKQSYLKEEILDAGLDADKFAMYIQEQKGTDQIDIDEFEFEELQNIVRNFK